MKLRSLPNFLWVTIIDIYRVHHRMKSIGDKIKLRRLFYRSWLQGSRLIVGQFRCRLINKQRGHLANSLSGGLISSSEVNAIKQQLLEGTQWAVDILTRSGCDAVI